MHSEIYKTPPYIYRNTWDWCAPDDKERFEDHARLFPNDPTIKYYQENPISYEFNRQGFRTPDDLESGGEGNVFLGCSHTMGVGHHLKDLWSYQVSQIVGGKFWNLGIGGTGCMTHYRLLLGWYKNLEIKSIFHYLPYYPRYEFLINDKPEAMPVGAHLVSTWPGYFGDFFHECLIQDSQINLIHQSMIHAIRGLSEEIGCNYYIINELGTITHLKTPNDEPSIGARDFMHYTLAFQKGIAEDMINMWKDGKKYQRNIRG
jgi:hypothetical protein